MPSKSRHLKMESQLEEGMVEAVSTHDTKAMQLASQLSAKGRTIRVVKKGQRNVTYARYRSGERL